MYSCSALSLTTASPVPGFASVRELGDAANGADFGAYLAQTVDQPATVAAMAANPNADTSNLLLDPAPATAAATIGKNLPSALPVAAMPQDDPQDEMPLNAAAETVVPAQMPAKFVALAALHLIQHRTQAHGLPEKAEKGEATDQQATEAALPKSDRAPVVVLAIPLILPSSATETIVAPHPAQPSKSDDVVDQLVRAQVPALENRLIPAPGQPTIVAAHPVKPTAPNMPQAAASPPPPAAQPITQVRIEVALPETVRTLAVAPVRTTIAASALLNDQSNSNLAGMLAISVPQAATPLARPHYFAALPETIRAFVPAPVHTATPASALLNDESTSDLAGMLAINAPQAVAQPLATTPAAPLARPHDFAALIERLSAAREAAGPHTVSVSLPHADFGRVQLHFRHDTSGLAVSLASSDPDFARIAAQAAPPILPVSETRSAENTNQQGSARSEDQGAQTSQNNQQRGQSHDRHGETQRSFKNHPRGHASPDKGENRSGIFA